MDNVMRGIFPVLQTPVSANGDLDEKSLEREVSFCIEAGAHGLVFPVLGSEFQFLSEEERQRLVEVVVGEAAGQVPVVAGVAGASAAVAVTCARDAARTAADAVIALPPYITSASREEIEDYYRQVARVVERPVFIQHSQAGMDPSFLQHLLQEIEHVNYVKEEMHPSAHNISAVLDQVGEDCLGVFGGGHGRWMLSELHRGASGFMPAAEMTDVHVRIWDAYQSGDEAEARRIFNQLLPLINLIVILGMKVCKTVLVRRGIIASAAMRMPGVGELDAGDQRELDQILENLQPLLRV